MRNVLALAFVFLVATGPSASAARVGAAARARQEPAATPAAAADAGVSETSSKRIGAVVDTLKDLLASIDNEEQQEGKNVKCAQDWCQAEMESKKTEIENGAVSLEDNQVLVKQHGAKITQLQYTLEKLTDDKAELSDAMEQAKGIREEENSKYQEDKTLNMQSVNQISTAINIVGKVHETGGFLQGGQVQKMQLNEPGESSFVLGVFKSLKKNLERNQAKADEVETKKTSMYDKLIGTKQQQLTSTEQEWESKQIILTETKTKEVQTNHDIADLNAMLKEAREYLAETTAACGDKEKEWQVRQEDRAKEKAAITEAISFLEITFKEKEQAEAALLQQQKDSADEDQEDLSAAPAFVQVSSSMNLASSLVSTASAELAALQGTDAEARQDVFDNVKGVIGKLINVLLSQQKEETEKRDWCETEIKKKQGEKTDSEDALSTLNATIDRKTAETESLVQEVADINTQIKESKERDESAKKVRTQAKEIYEAGTKDRMLALKVLKEATVVLGKFYETADNTGLLQKKKAHKQMPETFSGSSRKEGEGNVVIAMLQKITDDIEREQKDAEVAETEAATAYETQVKESRKEFDSRMEEITMRVTRKAKVLVQLDNHKETQTQKMDSLTALTQQLGGLSEDCDELLKNHDERKKAREFEVAQLRDVTDILSGSAAAVRTGLVQTDQVTAVGDKEFSALRDMSKAIDGLEVQAHSLAR